MSYRQSSLTPHNLDMVVAVTEAGINTTMRQFLKKMNNQSFEYYLLKDPAHPQGKEVKNTALADSFATKIQSKIDSRKARGKTYKCNPLEEKLLNKSISIMDTSLEVNPTIDKTKGYKNDLNKVLKSSNFHLGISGKLGRHKGDKTPIVLLKKEDGKVTFRLTFSELVIRWADSMKGEEYYDEDRDEDITPIYHFLREIRQDEQHFNPQKPIVIEFEVDIKLGDPDAAEYQNLPEPVRQMHKKLDPNTIFSVQQLYINLSSLSLQTIPTNFREEANDEVFDNIRKYFVNNFLETLKSQKRLLLGSTVVAKKPGKKSSFIPTDLEFQVQEYRDGAKRIQKLNTLNYLLCSEGRTLNRHGVQRFGWNWVEPNDSCHGVMALRRNIILEHLKGSLDEAVKNIFYKPYIKITVDTNLGINAKYEVNFDFHKDTQATSSYTIQSDGSLFLDYNAKDKDRGGTEATFGRELEGYASIKSSVQLEKNKIKISVDLLYSYDMTVFIDPTAADISGTASGVIKIYEWVSGDKIFKPVKISNTILKKTLHYELEMVVNKDELNVKYIKPAPLNLPKKSPSPKKGSYWNFEILSNGIKDAEAHLNGLAEGLDGFGKNLETILNSSRAFVLPGGSVFAFKEAAFSDNKDLVMKTTYKSPSSKVIDIE